MRLRRRQCKRDLKHLKLLFTVNDGDVERLRLTAGLGRDWSNFEGTAS